MAKYKLTGEGVQNTETMAFIPANLANRDWRKYQAWLAEGNKPLPIAEPQAPVVDENEEKIKAELRKMAIASLGDALPAGYK